MAELGFILFPAEFFIFKIVLFAFQSDAEETVFATGAITEESAGMAVLAVLAAFEAVGFVAIYAVVTQLVMEIVKTVDAALVLFEAVAVKTVFAIVGVGD